VLFKEEDDAQHETAHDVFVYERESGHHTRTFKYIKSMPPPHNPTLREAWRGMSGSLRVSANDMYTILASLRGVHARHALLLRDTKDVREAWDTTKKVLRLVAQWQWVQREWPWLVSGALEKYIAERDMALGVHTPLPADGWRATKRKRPEDVTQGTRDALMILADACEVALAALQKERRNE
jgi:hypothetical protein